MTVEALERPEAPQPHTPTPDSPNKPPKSLPECVDDLERGLAMCLIEYRSKAEDVLAAHLEAVERAENAHQFEFSKLIAENRQLRELLALRTNDIPCLWQTQNVMMMPDPNTKQPVQQNKNQKTRKVQNRDSEDDEDKQPLNSRKKKNQQEAPAGTWQSFVAWVPTGSALTNPEPWKPLPTTTLSVMSPDAGYGGKPGKGAKHSVMGVAGGQPFMNVLPGMPSQKEERGEDDSEGGSSKSGDGEREVFELLETWVASDREKKKLGKSVGNSDGESAFSGIQSGEEDKAFNNESPSIFILNPDAPVRVTWDLLSLTMVIYDMIMIPMIVFSLEETLFLVMMEWCTRCFWTLDIGWSCCTGVSMPDGSVEYSVPFILKKYAKSWLGLDLFIVGSDWTGYFFSSGGMGLSRLARISRVARAVRLLRMVRMQEVISNITERIQSDKMGLVVQGFKLLIFLVSISHMIACGWWGVGSISGKTWSSELEYDSKGVGLQYLTSLHWALSQFTGGMDEIYAANELERFFSVLMWVFGFMSAAVISSVLTSSLTQQYIIGGAGARKMAVLRKYLNQNHVPSNLAKRVCRSAKHAISGDLTPESVELLSVVSEPLKVEMHFQMYAHVLAAHPFFQDYLAEGPQVMRRVCHMAMSMLLLAVGDVVFTTDEVPNEPKMYFVASGILEYSDAYNEKEFVTEKMWVAEAAIWTTWKHQGNLTATNDVKLAVLDAQNFGDICRRWMKKMKGTFNPKLYASQFVEQLNKQDRLTDLSFG